MRKSAFISCLALVISLQASPVSASITQQWDSKTKIEGLVTIPQGTVVTVSPGTKITVGSKAKIIVQGELLAPQGLSLVGGNWLGLVVSGSATLTNFVQKGAQQPFHVTDGGSLTINGGVISGIKDPSLVDGAFVASNLHYQKGRGDGIVSQKPGATISIDKGRFSGSARGAGDFFSLSAGQSLTITNSSITKVHCAFHITGVENMKLDNLVIENNAYGFMMYGSSDQGSRVITNSIITNNDFGFDEGSGYTKNGAISISNSYIKKNSTDLGLFTKKVVITSPRSKRTTP